MKRIIYTSQSRAGISIKDVYEIIRTSHNRNSTSGLTGGLVFVDGFFYQVLEGLPLAVDERLAKIMADPRHFDVNIRMNIIASEPLFPNDWMALREQSQIDEAVFERAGYVPGMRDDCFGPEEVEAFLLDCFGMRSSITAC